VFTPDTRRQTEIELLPMTAFGTGGATRHAKTALAAGARLPEWCSVNQLALPLSPRLVFSLLQHCSMPMAPAPAKHVRINAVWAGDQAVSEWIPAVLALALFGPAAAGGAPPRVVPAFTLREQLDPATVRGYFR
jgi:hypothetical protein